MVHSGGVVAAVISQGRTKFWGVDTSFSKFSDFRNDREKRGEQQNDITICLLCVLECWIGLSWGCVVLGKWGIVSIVSILIRKISRFAPYLSLSQTLLPAVPPPALPRHSVLPSVESYSR